MSWKHIAGRERENLEGWIPALATEAEIREALEKAFDYRGDVTLTRKDGSTVEGYLYDRRSEPTLEESLVRIIPTPKPGAPVERVMRELRGHRGAEVYAAAIRRRARPSRPG